MIPDGFCQNAAGHLVPEDQVREQDKLRDATVRALADIAEKLNVALGQFKEKALADVADLVAISAEKYDVKIGGEKGNVSLTTYDGEYKLVRSTSERYQFTEEIEAAKALIDDCIVRWSEGANANIRALVDRAFRTDSQGQLKTSAVLELLRLDIDDDGWKRAMEALRDSIQTAGTATYIRLYKRKGKNNQYRQVPLDLAAV
ncbi:DUF3164 family protein [Microbulbifer sp. ANSA003]|uniref:DUF3164 family protein n=1 Tax=Microbulbifer okhotskensis TaxID=2926617 RepID=A0A9X2ET78_9GAMM|nr:DUF3164 family protein [Microbulbifer okhotskensis]MCO1335333.1 DUF3164 family protein [Microbulbifer okhotskensis]